MLTFVGIYYVLSGLGVVIGYHRLLAHRSFEATPWLKRFLVLLGLPAGTPLQWAGNHRHHHQCADQPGDPHSPNLLGFWRAHVGWYIGTSHWLPCLAYSLAGPGRMLFDAWHRPRTNQEYNHLAPDVAADPVLGWMSRREPYFVLCVLHALIPLGIMGYLFGVNGLVVVWATQVAVYNLGDAVDSVLHLVGSLPYSQKHDKARNWPPLGVILFGDGWHANHHAFPWSARQGFAWWQLDTGYLFIKLFAAFGWVHGIRVPDDAAIAAKRVGASSLQERVS